MKTASTLIVFLYGLMLGSAIRIEITPDVYTGENAGPANITCQLDPSDGANANIILLELLDKDGQPVVFLRKGELLSFADDYSDSSKFQAEGIINLHDSYLRFSIADPKKTDAGLYTCKLIFSDSSNTLQEQKASGRLILQKMDVNEAVGQLMEEMSALKKELEVQNAKGSVEITALKKSTQDLKEGLNGLKDSVSYRSYFTAKIPVDRVYHPNEDVIFDQVITRHGDGYNKSSGMFTAPRDGLYYFNLEMTGVVRKNQCCKGTVVLMVNGKEKERLAFSVAQIDDGYRLPHTSVSHVTALAQGDTVKARAIHFKMNWSWHSYFSGFMIQAY